MANTRNDDNERNQGSRQATGRDEGDMSVREAGQMGGERVRELVEEGKRAEGGGSSGSRGSSGGSGSGRGDDR
ncbi:hypothetical protein ACFOED_11085 [Vulcaniibacterium thermophilum]|jgi:hypothetical protein|uniref:Small hydrophilic protein n=1 Tax=Vulcaniibacterium thermophilum TaxID=1169913 RepID=A0A918YWL1_9GAMM|nr:hypothetical protein [Vulcaniibacterium thermophilum]GHE27821.1 hypothetical protein GCM10007167_06680 [Vulcaniibacterium thermophilum]